MGENRFFGCYFSFDEADLRIYGPTPFSSQSFEYKLKSGGLRYEIGVNIKNGSLVWIHGSYLCGKFPDVSIFRHRMKRV